MIKDMLSYDPSHIVARVCMLICYIFYQILMDMGKIITLYDMVLFFPHATDTLDKHNLDYFCEGAKPFLTACSENKLDSEIIWSEVLRTNPAKSGVAASWKEWEPGFLSDLILRYYNDLSVKRLSVTEVLDQATRESFRAEKSKLQLISSCFKNLCDELKKHAISEEKAFLHPLRSDKNGEGRSSKINVLQLDKMEDEHRHLGSLIKSLRHLTGNYTMHQLSSPSVPLAGIVLQAFDKELTQRLHLENNILFPKLRDLNF
jgi:regulator of cell morphogenesis and NO signaling